MKDICRDEALLSAFLDGELDDARAQLVRNHLDTCAPCRESLAELQAADQMVRDGEHLDPSPDFERNFWQKVSQLEQQQTPPLWKQWLQPSWRPALAIGLTACIAVGVMVLIGPKDDVSLEEMELAHNIEFLNDYDIIRDLDILENWDALEAMKERS